MRVVIQRVGHASVTINGTCKSAIGKGLLILVGIEETDGQEDIDWLCKKIVNLRVFDDENGVKNKSILDVNGEILVISQFTLHASTKKGNRPSYIRAAKPDISVPLYHRRGGSRGDERRQTHNQAQHRLQKSGRQGGCLRRRDRKTRLI